MYTAFGDKNQPSKCAVVKRYVMQGERQVEALDVAAIAYSIIDAVWEGTFSERQGQPHKTCRARDRRSAWVKFPERASREFCVFPPRGDERDKSSVDP